MDGERPAARVSPRPPPSGGHGTRYGDAEPMIKRKPSSPYLARQMSWCGKPEPGGGMHPPNPKCRMCLGQSRNARSKGVRTRKHTRIYSGSGRRSVIPYVHCVMYCLSLCASWGRSYACLCMCENLWNLPFYRACSSFYKPKGSSTLSGTPTGGPGDVL